VRLGPSEIADGEIVLPLSWHASGHEHLLPTFSGAIEISAAGAGTRLRLTGRYTVPFGVVGRFGDGVLGRRVAHRSLESLVHGFACRLESRAHLRHDAAASHPGPLVLDLSQQPHSEIYVG
jgi:hypothetical protein